MIPPCALFTISKYIHCLIGGLVYDLGAFRCLGIRASGFWCDVGSPNCARRQRARSIRGWHFRTVGFVVQSRDVVPLMSCFCFSFKVPSICKTRVRQFCWSNIPSCRHCEFKFHGSLRIFICWDNVVPTLQIVPGKDNHVAIELICTHIRQQLERRSRHFRRKMAANISRSLSRGPQRQPTIDELKITVLDQTPQLKVWFVISLVVSVSDLAPS